MRLPWPFDTYSSTDGDQREAQLSWWKDTDTGHWWLYLGDKEIGYYPRSLFNAAGIAQTATEFEAGGEIAQPGDIQTATDMGSGEFPAAGYGKAAFIRKIRYFYFDPDSAGYVGGTPTVSPNVTDTRCYDNLLDNSDDWGLYTYYGGAGRSESCR
jgi:hypothetical protein